MMPIAMAQKLHARFQVTHPLAGRNRLLAALRLFGWLDKYQLPLHIPCLASDLAKARRRPHRLGGKTRRAASRFGILQEEGIRAGINANRRLYSRRACPLIPAGPSLYWLIESVHGQHLPAVGLCPRIMDSSDVALLGRTPILEDSALEVLRAQEGVGLDLPPPIVIFTGSLSAKAVAEKLWISDRMRHIKYSMFFIKSYISSGDIKLAYIKGPGDLF
jgi:hypothetical protein